MKNNLNEKGRSMIEMLGVLAIIGVLSVGGIAGYSKAMTKYRINKTIEQITLIAGNVRAFYASQRSYAGLYSGVDTVKAIIKKAKLVPDEMWEGNSIKNVFGGDFILDIANKAKSGDEKAFFFQYFLVPEEICIELLTQDWTSANVNVIETYDNATAWENYHVSKTPINVDTAVNMCNRLADSRGSDKIIEFYIDVDVNSTYWQRILSN